MNSPRSHRRQSPLPAQTLQAAGLAIAIILIAIFTPLRADDAADSASEQVLARWTQMLSTDEMEGRGVGTKGLDVAADYRRGGIETPGVED